MMLHEALKGVIAPVLKISLSIRSSVPLFSSFFKVLEINLL